LVWPDLKSSPPINTFLLSANSTRPGTKVFWGDPLMKGVPSKIAATAYRVLGATSEALFSMLASNSSLVMLRPGLSSA